MKKIICLILSLILMVSVLSGCFNNKEISTESSNENSNENIIPELSVWDGSVATAFAGGDGSAENPYKIASADQFAFLAQEINAGKDYKGKSFSLLCDIDLNNLEWTPIGNGEHSFEGYFDGNHHIIENLKFSNVTKYFFTEEETKSTAGVIGLFGLCENASLYDINISSATINIRNPKEYNQLYAGVLIGRITSNQNSEVSNIKISQVTVLTEKTSNEIANGNHALYVGGAIGYSFNDSNTTLCLKNVQSEISINCQKSYSDVNNLGGIIGVINNRGILKCSNLFNDMTLKLSEVCMSDFYCGAFGYIYNNHNAAVSNIFSKVSANQKPSAMALGEFPNKWYAIAGNISSSKLTEDTLSLQNLFGYVAALDDAYEPFENIMKLYDIHENCSFSENNCIPCEELPENHGFDTNVWDLSDLSNPKLK